MKRQNITIGIPAFNEEGTIKHVLDALLSQKGDTFNVDKIIVVSDASTDHTDLIVRSYAKTKVELVRNNKRKGKNASLNYLFKNTKSPLLVIFDADVLIDDTQLIKGIVATFTSTKSDLIAGNVMPLPAKTRVERAINNFIAALTIVKNTMKNGNNIYSMRGPFYALSQNFYSKVKLPHKVPDDRYLYLYAKQHNFTFSFCKQALVYFRSPKTLSDQMLQATRFIEDKKHLYAIFASDFIEKEYFLNNTQKKKILFHQLKTDIISYFFIKVISVLVTFFSRKNVPVLWEKVRSTKQI